MKKILKTIIVLLIIGIASIFAIRNTDENTYYWWPVIGGARYINLPNEYWIGKNVCLNYQLAIYPDARKPTARVPKQFQNHSPLMPDLVPLQGNHERPLMPANTSLKVVSSFRIEPNGVMDAPFWSAANWLELEGNDGSLYLVGDLRDNGGSLVTLCEIE